MGKILVFKQIHHHLGAVDEGPFLSLTKVGKKATVRKQEMIRRDDCFL